MSRLILALVGGSAWAADNGRAMKPPMGWRDWNQYQAAINQDTMIATFDALVDRSRTVDGVPTSLADLGYSDAGLDDAWQNCGSYGPNNYTYHDASGVPQVDLASFPNFTSMTAYAHALNLTVGWYGNNCKCADHCTSNECFAADVNATLAYGFDSIKLDGCGKEENVQLWYEMFNATIAQNGGKTAGGQPGMLVENCHNGPNVPTPGWCPFHYYRSSTDIRPVFGSVLTNLNSVPPLAAQNLSTPGCWAYPDMLEVGVTNTQSALPPLSHTEARSHFGAWCIVSAPLILGLNLTDAPTTDAVWDIITNREAIAVNQDYAGASGTMFWQSTDMTPFSPCGWWEANCTFPVAQYWYKPLSGGDTAVLLMNNAPQAVDTAVTWGQVPGLTAGGSYKVRDIWAKADIGTFSGGYTAKALPSHDSAFLRLSPA